MIPVILYLALIAVLSYIKFRKSRLTWSEIRGVNRMLLTTPGPVMCRACEKELPDPILRIELGHGAVICEDCEEEINKELLMRLPAWFDSPFPLYEDPQVDTVPVYIAPPPVSSWELTPPVSGVFTFTRIESLCPNPNMQTRTCRWCPGSPGEGVEICDQCISLGAPISHYLR